MIKKNLSKLTIYVVALMMSLTIMSATSEKFTATEQQQISVPTPGLFAKSNGRCIRGIHADETGVGDRNGGNRSGEALPNLLHVISFDYLLNFTNLSTHKTLFTSPSIESNDSSKGGAVLR